jgi:hypothetical protein
MIVLVGVAAILIIVVGITIGGLRVEPRAVPAAGPDAFAVAEDREWRITRFAITSDLVVLRPTWIPARYRGSADCPSPWALVGTGATQSRTSSSGYYVEYRRDALPGELAGPGGRVMPDGRSCGVFELYGEVGAFDDPRPVDGLVETTVDARGTTVHVRRGVPRSDLVAPAPLPQFVWELWWHESGAFYSVISYDPDLELVGLIRVVRSLEPVRTEP